MNFTWRKLRHLVAVSSIQSIFLSQVCALSIGAQSVTDSPQIKDRASHSQRTTGDRNVLAMVSPPSFFENDPAASYSSNEQSQGLKFKLSHGKPQQYNEEKTAVANAQPLSEDDTNKLLKLLPELVQEKAKDFVLPARSLPTPSQQNRINEPFPPREQKAVPSERNSSPLQITSKRPVGSIDRTSNISITFSQPMVPIASQGSLETKNPPVQFTPPVEGQWKWFGTQTLTFEPAAKQLPMATMFQVKVPAGTSSVSGGKLADAQTWNFSTAPVQIVSQYPPNYQGVKPSTLIMARFNQRIDKEAILAMTRVSVGTQTFPVRAASQTEIDGDPALKKQLKGILENTFLVFKTSTNLPLARGVSVKIGPQIKSAEGPLLSKKSVDFKFRTYGPFTILPQSDYQKSVTEDGPMTMSLSNNIDRKSVNASTVKITPAIPDVHIEAYGESISISGNMVPNTTYQVQLTNGIKDVFGQNLSAGNLKFHIKHATKQLILPGDMIVLPTESKPKLQFTSVNLTSVEVSVYSAGEDEYSGFEQDSDEFCKRHKAAHIEKVRIKNVPEQAVVTQIDLSRWLKNNRGSLVIRFNYHELPYEEDSFGEHYCWVQCTNTGLDAFVDDQAIEAWVTDLSSGLPIKGAQVYLSPGKNIYQTDVNGLVSVPLTDKSDKQVLIARSGKDAAIVGQPYKFNKVSRETSYRWYLVTDRSPYKPGEKINVKGILRKRGPERTSDLAVPSGIGKISYDFSDSLGNQIGKGNTELNKFGSFDFSFTLPKNVNLGNVSLNVSCNSNDAKRTPLSSDNLSIPVSEYRRPEFELKVNNEGPPVQIVKGASTISASTTYFAGGNLSHSDIVWNASSKGTVYSPPGWSEFRFGRGDLDFFRSFTPIRHDSSSSSIQSLKGATDGSGKSYLHIDYLDVSPSEPSSLEISATVQDVNRQTWTDKTTLLVHPAELYVGTKFEKTFVKKDGIIPLSLIATNIDGKAIANTKIKLEVYRSSVETVDDKEVEKKDDIQLLDLTSAEKPRQAVISPKLGGLYTVIATITDGEGRTNQTENQFWSDGEGTRAEANTDSKFQLQKLLLLPEKSKYKPGEKATILIQSPFFPAEGLATIWHDGLSTIIPFHMTQSSYNLEVPISQQNIPNMAVQVDVLGIDKQNPKAKNAPAEATDTVNIDISTEDRRLTVEAKPEVASAGPGKEISVNLAVTDHKGAAVADAEVAVAVVDDALLSLLNYRFNDPIESFYPGLRTYADVFSTSTEVLREREDLDMTAYAVPDATSLKVKNLHPRPYFHRPRARLSGAVPGLSTYAAASPAPHGGGVFENLKRTSGMPLSDTQLQIIDRSRESFSKAKMEVGPQGSDATYVVGANQVKPVQIRSNFDALAKWAPSVITDSQGHAVVKFKLPDNLTRYRVMAIASHAANQFGTGESSLTVRLPLMVKPSAPRFLNYGDHFELPIVLRNQTDETIELDVAARASNAKFTSGQGRHTTIPANDRVEVRLPATTINAGTAKFQVIAVAGTNSDAAEFTLPVYTPATTEAFATYGQIENGSVAQSIERPKDVIKDFGSLDVSTSTTLLETLTDAFLYLQHYPFECSEQLSSRLISISLLKDMLKEFHAVGLPSEREIQASVADDLQKLQSRQQSDGSFALWRSNERVTYPYVTLNVAQALILCNKAGYSVDRQMLYKAMRYLKNIDKHIADYKGSARTELKIFALYLRDQNGDTDFAAAHALLSAQPLDSLSLESMGFLLQIFAHKDPASRDATSLYNYLNNCIVETASTANVVRNSSHDAIWCSDYRLFDSPSKVKAIMLDSLLTEGKAPDMVTKLMRSLLGGQIKGRWRNTQENAYVLLAMRHYFDKYEKTTPDLVAEAWLGKTFIGESSFKGRSNDCKTISLPMSYLTETSKTEDLILRKTGAGRLYYRLGLNYAPESLHLSAMDRGFKVMRTYESVTNKDDVKKDSNGVWQFKSGSLVKVKLNITAASERYFVALVDPLPAGAESLNQDLLGTESVPNQLTTDSTSEAASSAWESSWRWWIRNWWTHENKRDNQTEIFADQLWGGSHEYSYLMRATTPGTYIVPPTKAEEMYAPETFGRTASETVIIE